MPLNADRLRRVQDIIEEARTKQPEDRAAFVARACGDDAEVRDEVESLLEHADQAGEDFLKVPEPGFRLGLRGIPTDGRDPPIDTRIGPYTIRSVIAAGGMGTVYLAEQDNPRREVALKVMTAGAFTTRSALRRFEYESQILAKLRHPNIAHVYEAGTHQFAPRIDGQGATAAMSVPYFVMEYVPDALPITKYAREHKLDLRERLHLFLRVCDAVHHGHQKGIIHRDLKPGNILVDSAGEPKVIDFGVAKSTDSDVAVTTLRTDAGQILGTLQYMSPEQCAADPHGIDTRSDVYSLGVVLYELLTERLPYDVSNMTLHSAIRRICEHTPTRPSTLGKCGTGVSPVRGDLETIILKGLEKDREKRYQSVADLATDIRRYLAGEPISARPPTPWTRAMRWITRHPMKVTAIVCILFVAVTLLATVMTTWLYDRKPYKIELFDERREARLLAYSGSVLHRWGGKRAQEINFAALLNFPPALGGRLHAIVGFGLDSDSRYRGELCAFDISGDRDEPIWHSRIEERDVPAGLMAVGRGPENTSPSYCGIVANIFDGPNAPGDEIVMVYDYGPFSSHALRIFNQTGDALFQVWQDGGIESMYWLSKPRVLLCAGWDEYLKLNDERFSARTPPNAPIVFAIRPVRGFVRGEFVDRTLAEEAPFHAEWAKYLEPPRDQSRYFKFTLDRPLIGDTESLARLSVSVCESGGKETPGQVAWLIDEHGVEVPGSRIDGDPYLFDECSNKPRLPDPNSLRLLDLPPAPVPPPYLRPIASAPATASAPSE